MSTPCFVETSLPRSVARIKEFNLPRFDYYLQEVQQRLGLAPISLIRPWTAPEVAAVENALRIAIVNSGIATMQIPNFTGTNQSKGNKAADFFIDRTANYFPIGATIEATQAKGYPDRIFRLGAVGFFMEFKATSDWNDTDSNRRVLTSSPLKMINLINSGLVGNPPAHFVCTVIYDKNLSLIRSCRLDFLEPNSEVNIRLEASTSQKILTQSPHKTFQIP